MFCVSVSSTADLDQQECGNDAAVIYHLCQTVHTSHMPEHSSRYWPGKKLPCASLSAMPHFPGGTTAHVQASITAQVQGALVAPNISFSVCGWRRLCLGLTQ